MVERVEPVDARHRGLRPRHRADAQLRRRRHRHPQLGLHVPRGGLPEPAAVRGDVPGRVGDRARPELPVDPADPRRRERGHRQQRGPPAEAPLDRADRRRAHRPLPRRGRARRGRSSSCTRSTGSRTRKACASATPRSSTGPTRRAASSRRRWCAPGVPYRIIGGTKFYDRREVKDALAYLRSLVNPDDEVGWKRIVNVPKRGVGDTSVRKIEAYAQGASLTFREAMRDGAAAGVTGKALGGIRDLLEVMGELEADADAGGVSGALEAMLEPHRLPRRARGRAHDRGAGPHREPGRARRRRAGVRRATSTPATRPRSSRSRAWTRPTEPPTGPRPGAGVPRGDLARHRHGRRRRRRLDGHADDAAQREGPRVPGRVPHRARGRDLPAHALAR